LRSNHNHVTLFQYVVAEARAVPSAAGPVCLQHVGRDCVGADAGVEPAARPANVGRHASSGVLLRPDASRSRRQPILARHGRKYGTSLTRSSRVDVDVISEPFFPANLSTGTEAEVLGIGLPNSIVVVSCRSRGGKCVVYI